MKKAEASAIDFDHLRQLSEGELDFELELLQTFLIDTAASLQQLHSALQANDLRTVQRQAHQLRGASGGVGAFAMQRLAEHLDYQARQGDLREAPELCRRLSEQLEAVQAVTLNLAEELDTGRDY